MRGPRPKEKVKIGWLPNFAYAIGLLTSDGCVVKDGRHIQFKSSELELINALKTALSLQNKASRSARGGEKEKKYFNLQFGDVIFHRFLNKIGLHPTKSKTIESVSIPNKFFADFLRGLFDGDGTFYHSWDKRWPKSLVFQVSFASASLKFINWLKSKLSTLYNLKGFICKGDGVFNLRYVKGDSRKLFSIMYYQNNLLFLKRKHDKIKRVLEFDQSLKLKTPR